MQLPGHFIKPIVLIIVLQLLVTACYEVQAQQDSIPVQSKKKDSVPVKDVNDILRSIFRKNSTEERSVKTSSTTILPSLGYNPSFGFNVGGSLTATRQFGEPSHTTTSVFSLAVSITTKGIFTVRGRHNVFAPQNKWNMQGDWQLCKMGAVDYGIGTGTKEYRSRGLAVNNEVPSVHGDSAFPIKYNHYKLLEKVYRRIGRSLYIGGGVNFDIMTNIKDERQTADFNTPHQRYSLRNDFDPGKYSANGFLIAVQHNSMEHPLRSYGGMYIDLSFCFNQKWIGSSQNSIQAMYDIRKYFSLSKRNPEHVLALWHWASYLLSGEVPYLAMPATAYDTYLRSGRGYTYGRFKGPSYAYFETEWRFPITRNKLISGVCFVNYQTASDDIGKKVFGYWEPGFGLGLRILFDKFGRTNLCADVAQGHYGSKGIFFGLAEVF